jgi:predicted nucleic acid-binding protein
MPVYWQIASDIVRNSVSGHKQWADAYLIALAQKHSLKLATLEAKLDNMDNPRHSVLWKIW